MIVSVFLTHDLTDPATCVTRLGTARVVDGVFSWEPARDRWLPDSPALHEIVASVEDVLRLSHVENPADPWPWLFSPHGSLWGRIEPEPEVAPRRHAWRPRAAREDSLRDRLGALTPGGLDWFLAGEECTVCGLGRRGVEAAGLDSCRGLS